MMEIERKHEIDYKWCRLSRFVASILDLGCGLCNTETLTILPRKMELKIANNNLKSNTSLFSIFIDFYLFLRV